MRIALASLQQESNSLSPVISRAADFDLAFGEEMFSRIHVMDQLREAGATPIPTLYAHALPGGPLAKADFLRLAHEIIEGVPTDVDGVWLYLHGALYVREIGSGEEYLLRRLREKLGYTIPIAVALDFHANNTDALCDLCNVVCGFRTAPHVDQSDAERKAMALLLTCVRDKLLPRPRMARANVIVPGDCVQTSLPPLRAIMAEADRMEEVLPDILCAQVFGGQPWVDAPYTGPSMVVTPLWDGRLAQTCADKLARMYYDARHDFRFLIEALPPGEAISAAMDAPEAQVFLTDSGDNTTAGAAGDNALLLGRLLEAGAENFLLAGIADEAACAACYRANLGDTLTLEVGGSLDPRSERVTVTGKLVHRGDILSYTGGDGGPSATLDCGRYTLVVTGQRAGFTSPEIFDSIGLDFSPYKIVAVKLGYLFPGLAARTERAILVLTPGSSAERLEDMGHTHIRRPMYPLDDDFLP